MLHNKLLFELDGTCIKIGLKNSKKVAISV